MVKVNLPVKYAAKLTPRAPLLVTTIDEKSGGANVAPYGWVTQISQNPPLILFATRKSHRTYKNVTKVREFVLNLPSSEIVDKVWITAQRFPPTTSKIEEAGLTTVKARKVRPPRIAECDAHIECVVEKIFTRIGDHALVIGRVIACSANEGVFEDDFKVDFEGKNWFVCVGDDLVGIITQTKRVKTPFFERS